MLWLHCHLLPDRTIDLDIEIKFSIGPHKYSLDVHKRYLEELKYLYKALIKIGSLQETNAQHLEYAHSSLEIAAKSVNRSSSSQTTEQEFKKINEYVFEWLTHFHATYNTKDFTSAFETFINQ